MLVLTRKEGERILIADGLIKITINRIAGNRVSVGIDAPMDVSIAREETQAKPKPELAKA